MISMVVVLPAPLGPSRPKHTPSGTLNDTPATARVAGYCLTSSRTSRMGVLTAFAADWRAILADFQVRASSLCARQVAARRATCTIAHNDYPSIRQIRARRPCRRGGALGPRFLGLLRRIPAAGQAPGRAKAAVERAQRDAVHRRAPGVGAVDAPHAARADRGAGVRATRRPRSGAEDAGAHLAHPDAADLGVGRAVDHDAVRVHGVPQRAGTLLGLPVAAVPPAGVPVRQQERRDAGRTPARRARARDSAARTRLTVAVRRGAAPAQPPRLRDSAGLPVAGFQRALPRQQTGGRRLARRVSQRGNGLGPVRARRAPGGSRPQLPAVALPSPEDRRAHHRLQARHRRHRWRFLSRQGAGAQVLSGAVADPDLDVSRAAGPMAGTARAAPRARQRSSRYASSSASIPTYSSGSPPSRFTWQ